MKSPDKILSYWKTEKFTAACVILCGVTFNALSVMFPVFTGKLIDSVDSSTGVAEVARFALLLVAVMGFVQLLRYTKRFHTRRFANKTVMKMRRIVYKNIVNSSVSVLENERVGNLMTRITTDVDLCVEGMRKLMTEIFDTGVLMAAYLAMMLIYDVGITLAAVVFVPVAMFFAEKMKKLVHKTSSDYREAAGSFTGLTYEMIDNAALYRLSGMDEQNAECYAAAAEALARKFIKANIPVGPMEPVYGAVALLGVAAVIFLGVGKVTAGGWSVGDFAAFTAVFVMLADKSSRAARMFNSVQKSRVSWRRIKPYLSVGAAIGRPSMCANGQSVNGRPMVAPTNILHVNGLSFRYDKNGVWIIKDVSFDAKPGEIINITGATASGKSTLALAMLGLYPYEGSVMICGKELRDVPTHERSSMISYMGHDPQLFSGTIYENITLGEKIDVTDVLRDVCFDVDLSTMPDGLDTLTGNSGIRLSGGQQARIALSRALVNKHKIIILDDPFSAVDSKTAAKIKQNLRKNYRESIFIITGEADEKFFDKTIII